MNDFIIESKGYCFFCLDEISPRITESSTVHSLQYLSRFLGVDRRKVFPDTGNIPPHLLMKVEMSRLKSELCDGCSALNDSFSKVCRRLEKVQLEAISYLEDIYRKLLKRPTDVDHFDGILDSLGESIKYERGAKHDILNVLRTDAIQKCSLKLGKARPRVKVRNLTNREIIEAKNKFKFKSRRLPAGNPNDINSCSSLPILKQTIKAESDENFSDVWHDDLDADPLADLKQDVSESDNDDLPQTSFSTPKQERRVAEIIPSRSKRRRKTSTKAAMRKESCQNSLISGQRSDPKDLKEISENIEEVPVQGRGGPKSRCKLCDRLFTSFKNAKRHVKDVHLKEKPHRCPGCSKAFSRKSEMQTHMEHNHPGSMPYRCTICSKEYSMKTTWRAHIHSHSRSLGGSKPYHCPICTMAFWRNVNFKRHLLVHSGIRPHRCNVCEKAYSRRYELTRHLHSSHKRE